MAGSQLKPLSARQGKMMINFFRMNNLIFNVAVIDRIIEMAWEDRTPFDVITLQFGIKEQQIIELMRREMKASSFRLWRERVHGRATKHSKLYEHSAYRFKCSGQRPISSNNISKRN